MSFAVLALSTNRNLFVEKVNKLETLTKA